VRDEGGAEGYVSSWDGPYGFFAIHRTVEQFINDTDPDEELDTITVSGKIIPTHVVFAAVGDA